MSIETITACKVTCQICGVFVLVEDLAEVLKYKWELHFERQVQRCHLCSYRCKHGLTKSIPQEQSA